jgi:hypothetical protein
MQISCQAETFNFGTSTLLLFHWHQNRSKHFQQTTFWAQSESVHMGMTPESVFLRHSIAQIMTWGYWWAVRHCPDQVHSGIQNVYGDAEQVREYATVRIKLYRLQNAPDFLASESFTVKGAAASVRIWEYRSLWPLNGLSSFRMSPKFSRIELII